MGGSFYIVTICCKVLFITFMPVFSCLLMPWRSCSGGRVKVRPWMMTNVGCLFDGKMSILEINADEVQGIMTNNYFEVFAPGMKAKLDPTYRRVIEDRRLPVRSEILGKIARSSHQSLMPFTVTRQSLATSGRR
jgi:hypothetical protein